MMLTKFGLLLAAAVFLVNGCKSEETFEDLGTGMTSPVDVEVSDDGTHFYVLNSDFDRTYNAGSILTIDEDGNKVGAVSTPRMGRAMKAAGDYLLVGFGRQDENNAASVQLYDISTPASPKLIKTFDELVCNPVNFAMVKDYDHFGLVCSSGSIFIGTLPTSLSAPESATIKKVRRYSVIRRALYIDPVRELMFGFTTKFDKQTSKDSLYSDALSYSDEGVETAGGNEIPDEMESRKTARNNKSRRRSYQFMVYDIKAEREDAESNGCIVTGSEDCVFPERKSSDPVRVAEERFIYYKASNFDGTPDLTDDNPDQKYYRTNFHTAVADPDDPNSFYLSHRGVPNEKGSRFANDVIRVTFTGEVRATENVAPSTQDVFSFERVFGFKGSARQPNSLVTLKSPKLRVRKSCS